MRVQSGLVGKFFVRCLMCSNAMNVHQAPVDAMIEWNKGLRDKGVVK
jgi:hypothetical protein